ncbi:actin-binding protein wsp1-like [Miscanthus floridulus]|uniref:actin-binding protein wsp1-like n=1 Tax=Miscanthus floridulus TaxID=154761 RepID=UPI00345AE1DF
MAASPAVARASSVGCRPFHRSRPPPVIPRAPVASPSLSSFSSAAAAPSSPTVPATQRQAASACDALSPPPPSAQRHRHRHRRPRPPPPPPPPPPRRQRLNFGERLGIAFAGVAVAMQVVLGAFLVLRAWQLRRLNKAEVSSSTRLT